jgi:hypothetical protein
MLQNFNLDVNVDPNDSDDNWEHGDNITFE